MGTTVPGSINTKRLMKRAFCNSVALSVLIAGTSLRSLAQGSPGQVDFGTFTPPGNGSEFVEIQVRSNLLSLAAQLVEKQQPDAAKVIRSVESIHVNVIGLTDANRADLEKRVQQIRHDLESRGWDHNVAVQQEGKDVGIYTRTRGGEALAGLVITVIESKKEVVLINVVGDIKPEQVAALGDKLNIKPLKDAADAIKK